MPSSVLPADTPADRASKEARLSDAKAVGANAVRIWGGGLYVGLPCHPQSPKGRHFAKRDQPGQEGYRSFKATLSPFGWTARVLRSVWLVQV